MPRKFGGVEDITVAFHALGALLASNGLRLDCVVAGGAAVAFLGALGRTTIDVDVLALRDPETSQFQVADIQFPERIQAAITRVGDDLGLDPRWLNTQMASNPPRGFPPPGMEERLTWTNFGALHVAVVDRRDLIALKARAALDDAPRVTRHLLDLEALRVTADELAAAVAWVRDIQIDPEFDARLTWVRARVLG